MKIIVGLGNPGEQYWATRHNAGVWLIDRLAQGKVSDYGWRKSYDALVYKLPDMILVKTGHIFMNESGRLLQGLDIDVNDLYVAHDDLDLRLGEYKIQKGVGPKLHYGVQSIEQRLGTKDFWRIRIGVDNRDSSHRLPGEEYVLQKFLPEEKEVLAEVLNKIADEINQANS